MGCGRYVKDGLNGIVGRQIVGSMRRNIKDVHCVFHAIDSPYDLIHEMKPTKGTLHGFSVLDVARPAAFVSALEALHEFTSLPFEAYITSFHFPKNQHRC